MLLSLRDSGQRELRRSSRSRAEPSSLPGGLRFLVDVRLRQTRQFLVGIALFLECFLQQSSLIFQAEPLRKGAYRSISRYLVVLHTLGSGDQGRVAYARSSIFV